MSPLNSGPSSVVLGAGLMGRLLAWQLARAGHRVTVYEAGSADAQTSPARVAAAMLAPLAESAITEPSVVGMGRYALTRWPELIAQLSQPVFFQQEGTLILWHRQDAAEAQRFAGLLRNTNERVPGLPKLQTLDGAGVRALEPSLENRFAQGLYLPGEGQLDNRQLLAALLHELQILKVELHWNSPRAPQDFAPGQPHQPDWVFDCRGIGAAAQWGELRGVRGEVARIHAPDVSLSRPTRLIHPRYPIYIAPKQDHLFVIGATEIESNDLSPPSVRSTLELLSAAYAVHPGFGEGRILEIATQCRPTLPDNLPAIRRLGPRTLQINGLYRHGFMISPALLDVVLELVQEQRTTLAGTLDLQVEEATV
ncbi:MAG: FAD-dependent oxidoreductase [Pseudomonadota bacterium]